MTSSQTTIAVLSIGQMGLGIAKLLLAHNFRMITNVSDRSAATRDRAKSAGIEQLDSDAELVRQADYVLSIVPPRDAGATARRIVDALKTCSPGHGHGREAQHALWFLDLNAGSPDGVRVLYDLFAQEAPDVTFVDGGIIGAPPSLKDDGTWFRPGIPVSGPQRLDHAPVEGARLASVLNTRFLNAEIGTASGLKACFAALSKGFTALALQSYTTANNLRVLPDLQFYLDRYNPGAKDKAEKSIVGCTTKAYRWVEEMYQIGQTFAQQGGFKEQANVFREIAGVYQSLADLVEQQGAQGLDEAAGVVEKLGGHLNGEAGRE